MLTGFHSATSAARRGSVSTGTNVLAMNVIGKMTANPTPCTASGVGRRLPSRIPSQMIANENATMSA